MCWTRRPRWPLRASARRSPQRPTRRSGYPRAAADATGAPPGRWCPAPVRRPTPPTHPPRRCSRRVRAPHSRRAPGHWACRGRRRRTPATWRRPAPGAWPRRAGQQRPRQSRRADRWRGCRRRAPAASGMSHIAGGRRLPARSARPRSSPVNGWRPPRSASPWDLPSAAPPGRQPLFGCRHARQAALARPAGRPRTTTHPRAGSASRSASRHGSPRWPRLCRARHPRCQRCGAPIPRPCRQARRCRIPVGRRTSCDTWRGRRRPPPSALSLGGRCAGWPARYPVRDPGAAAPPPVGRRCGHSRRRHRWPHLRRGSGRRACAAQCPVRRRSASPTCRGWQSRRRRRRRPRC